MMKRIHTQNIQVTDKKRGIMIIRTATIEDLDAVTKVEAALSRARDHGYPFRMTVEEA